MTLFIVRSENHLDFKIFYQVLFLQHIKGMTLLPTDICAITEGPISFLPTPYLPNVILHLSLVKTMTNFKLVNVFHVAQVVKNVEG